MTRSRPRRSTEGTTQALLLHPPVQRTSIRRRILWQSLLLAGFTVMVLSLLSTIVGHSLIRNRVLDQLSSTIASRENLLSQSLGFDRERTGLLAAQIGRRTDVATLRPGTAVIGDLWQQLLNERIPVKGMAYFDASGRAVDRMGADIPSPSAFPSATSMSPVLNRRGKWEGTDVYAPVHREDGTLAGVLAVRYDPAELLTVLAANEALGQTADLSLLREQGGVVSTMNDGTSTARHFSDATPIARFAIPQAISGESGVFSGKDEWGVDVLAAYRSVPATGWNMVLKVDEDDALLGWERFAYVLLTLDGVLLLLTAVFGMILSRQLSSPILELARKLRSLNPRHWAFRQSIATGDEVEFLDSVAAELTARLRAAYAHLEEKVRARTRELQKQYLLDRTILENIEYGVFVVNAHGAVVEVNPAAQRILRLTREEMAGKVAAELLRFYRKNEPLRDVHHPIVKALRDKKPVHFFYTDHLTMLVAKDALLPVMLTVTPLLKKDALEGALVIIEDIHEESQIDAMKSDFIALASHQLRTPLSSLRWYLELLEDEKDPRLSETQESYLEQMDHASKRMVTLLDDLLRITHLEGGEIRAEKQEFDIRKMMQQLEAEWQPIATERGLKCAFSLPSRGLKISSDPVLLHLVLQNLFTNSMKYSQSGTEIRVGLVIQKRAVVLTVADNGMGIPTEEQSQVFRKFFRAKNVRRTDTDGSGLGLYLTKMIVENLGGTIDFVSHPGKGTTFTVKLPVK